MTPRLLARALRAREAQAKVAERALAVAEQAGRAARRHEDDRRADLALQSRFALRVPDEDRCPGVGSAWLGAALAGISRAQNARLDADRAVSDARARVCHARREREVILEALRDQAARARAVARRAEQREIDDTARLRAPP